MKRLKVDSRILWDKNTTELVTATGDDIIVEVMKKPKEGYGFLLAERPSGSTIRWTVEGVTGKAINPNSNNQVIWSGTYLQLLPDHKNPRVDEWEIYLYPVDVVIRGSEAE